MSFVKRCRRFRGGYEMKLIKKITGRLYLALPITHRADELRLSPKRPRIRYTLPFFFRGILHRVIFNSVLSTYSESIF